MKITIYQINIERDKDRICFGHLDLIKKFSPDADRTPYDKVYDFDEPDDGEDIACRLEKIYERFNMRHPSDYTGRSMSVSDIVRTDENGDIHEYFVDDIGFRELIPGTLTEKEPEV